MGWIYIALHTVPFINKFPIWNTLQVYKNI